MYDDYIAHHGIPNQKWGVRHGPPYPVVRGSGGKPKTTSIVKSKLKATTQAVADARAKRKASVAEARQKAQEKRIQQREDQKAATREKLREQIVRHPKELYKHKKDFSRVEIEELIKEIEFDRKIKDVKISEVKRGIEAYSRMKDIMSTTFQVANSAKGIYNIMADINNALIDDGKSKGKKWTKLGESKKDDKKDDNKKD